MTVIERSPIRRRNVPRARSSSMSSISQQRRLLRPTRQNTGLDGRPIPYMSRLQEMHRRNQSTGTVYEGFKLTSLNTADPLPPSLEPLDLHPTPVSPSNLLGLLILGVSDLETRLSQVDLVPKQLGADIIEEGTDLMRDGLDFLDWLKSEARAHIPDFDLDFGDLSLTGFRSRLPDFTDVKSRLPDFEFDFDVKGRLEMVSASFEDARTCLAPLDMALPSLADPETYMPTLRARITAIHEQLSDISNTLPQIPSLSPPKMFTDLLPDFLGDAEEEEPQDDSERVDTMAREIGNAIKLSENGKRLITFKDLPQKWKNNEYMITGYRFIPASPRLLLLSMFALHNEFLNIHTHFIPLLFLIPLATPFIPWIRIFGIDTSSIDHLIPASLSNYNPYAWFTSVPVTDIDPFPRYMFFLAAAACLACSTLWHVCTGCSNIRVLQNGARTDYVGIGWLISASLATLIYYGYSCHPVWLAVYIGLTICTGIAGTVAPFQTWFDERKNKLKRIAFFLILTGCGIIPMIHMSFLKGSDKTLAYLAPVGPSIVAYLTGLVFYATHFPECIFPGKFDSIGGSHAIWHVFIVIAIRIHWRAVETFQSHVGADGICPL
ncbi:hypothetical protein FRB94_010784 [Tulasnella sp. JGI-2019a]|nr:hypothetical protein FRB93_013901 [Tulasnella sp. JGI-2019a]KAG9010256.1 hypothetical protein FRB94_010784 [Tulasnella sp. JGI-2019a]KAG9035899.1 hypothetical protein FRB95_010302 [Tulasnella sp. JGI-2019a]